MVGKEVNEMARPRRFESDAAKQAAYRARQEASLTLVDRAALDALHGRLERLQGAIACAARQGSPFASRCRAVSIDSMLDKLVDAFFEECSPRESVPSKT